MRALALAALLFGCGPGSSTSDAGAAQVKLELRLAPRASRPVTSLPLDVSGAGLQLDTDYPDGGWAALPLVMRRVDAAAQPVVVASGGVAPGRYGRVRLDAVGRSAVLDGGGELAVDSHVEPIALPLELSDGESAAVTFELTLLDDPAGAASAILLTRSASANSPGAPGDAGVPSPAP